MARTPIFFERNAGQAADKSADWVANANTYRMALNATGATITPAAPSRSDILRMEFLNARPEATARPLEPLPGKTNYLIGRDPKRWIRNLETYGRIEYEDVYDGIDVSWYGNQGQLEYDFLVKPGADPNRIRMRFEGTRKLTLEADGDVRIETPAGAMTLRLPEVYQEAAGARQRVQGRYLLRAANELGFELAGYDKSKPLMIDPTLAYGTYFGSGLNATAIASDAAGNVYIGGNATTGLPLASALQPGALGTSGNAWVAKFDPTGTTLIYSTYVGGSRGDNVRALAVTADGELIATGQATSPDFPLVNPIQSQGPPPGWGYCIPVAFKLNASGSAFIYSTYLGGLPPAGATPWTVATDVFGDAYIAGEADMGFATTPGAYQTSYAGGWSDAFIVKFDPSGRLIYSTLLGGAGTDYATGIAVDRMGAVYVDGLTTSKSFPGHPPGARTTNAGGIDAFVAKLNPEGSGLDWLTFLGGTGDDAPNYCNSLVLDPTSGMVYIAGYTTSTDLPTTKGVIQPESHGPVQGFIASINPDGMSFGFVTYLGGGKEDYIRGIALTPSGLVVVGTTTSPGFPVSNAIQPAFTGWSTSLYASTNSGGSFTAADNGLPGSVIAISPVPSSSSTLLAASGSSYAWFRTTDGGATWTRSGSVPLLLYWYSTGAQIVWTPANPQVVYSCYPYSGGQGILPVHISLFAAFRSDDGGSTWRPLAYPPASSDWLVGLAVSPTDANTILEVTLSGAVFRSTDGGASFTKVSMLPSETTWASPTEVASSPDGSVYVAVMQNVYKSTDFGTTWTEANGIPEWQGMGPIAVSASNPSVVYAGAMWSSQVYTTADAGTTWSQVTSPGMSFAFLAVAPTNANVVYGAYGNSVVASSDGGTTWSTSEWLPPAITALGVSPSVPSTVYAGDSPITNGFAAKLSTNGQKLLWSTFYSGLLGTSPNGVAALPEPKFEPLGPGSNVASGSAVGGTLYPGQVWIAGAASGGLPVTPNAYSTASYVGPAFLARISDFTADCTYWLNPSSVLSYGSQSTTFAVTAPSGCAWTATPSDSSWITLTWGNNSGSGSGVFQYWLAANSTGSTRTGSVEVGGQTFAIAQADSSCTYSTSGNTNVPATGGSVSIAVTASTGCPWSVVPDSAMISVVSGGSGTGNGTVTLSVAPNDGVQWYSPTVQVGPQTVTLQEANICSYTLSPLTLSGAAASGTMTVTANLAGCSWSPQSDQAWLTVSGSGYGSGTFPYFVTENDTGAARTAHVTLDHRQFTVTQQSD
jgi:hypothetical protein